MNKYIKSSKFPNTYITHSLFSHTQHTHTKVYFRLDFLKVKWQNILNTKTPKHIARMILLKCRLDNVSFSPLCQNALWYPDSLRVKSSILMWLHGTWLVCLRDLIAPPSTSHSFKSGYTSFLLPLNKAHAPLL